MTLLFMDGFDHYGNAELSLKYNMVPSTLNYNLSSAYARHNGYGLIAYKSMSPDGTSTLKKPFIASTTIIIGIAMYMAELDIPGENVFYAPFYLMDGTDVQVKARINTDYTLSVFNGDDTLLGTTTNTVEPFTWYYLELKVFVSTTVGTVDIKVNETSWLSETGKVTQVTASNTIDGFSLVGNYGNIAMHYDDLYICDTNGAQNNDFLGDITIETLRPNGAGNYSQWTPSAGLNYENVDEILIDKDSTYNSHRTIAEKDSYTLSDLEQTGIDIKGIAITTTTRKDDAGSRGVRPFLRTNLTDYTETTIDLTDTYKVQQDILELNPDDSAAWEEADIDALEVGIEIIS